jgi:membrane-bound lytic murein transglycosylase D
VARAVHPFRAALFLVLVSLGTAGCAVFHNGPSASVAPQVLAAPEDVEQEIDAEVNLPPVKPFGDSESPSGRVRRKSLLDPDGAVPSDLKSVLPGDVTQQVSYYVDYFTGAGRDRFALWLSRSTRYAPMMRRIFAENQLPPDLIYLAMIESGFSTKAVSRASAVGPWQFIAGTGRRYDLKISRYVDERRDPEEATRAAIPPGSLRMFRSWDLALASYNAGEGKIDKGVRRISSNFWHMRKTGYLAQETSNYVPQYLAALMIARNPSRYGFQGISYQEPLRYETLLVRGSYSLASLAELAGTHPQELRDLNPALIRSVTPPSDSYALRVPPGSAQRVAQGMTRLASSRPADLRHASAKVHLVRRGQTIRTVAARYAIRPRRWPANGLRTTSRLRAGAKLRVPESSGAGASRVAQAMPEELPVPEATARGAASVGRGATAVYVVRRGDTLHRISLQFNTTVRDLMRRNGLDRTHIEPGRRLIVPASARSTQPARRDGEA